VISFTSNSAAWTCAASLYPHTPRQNSWIQTSEMTSKIFVHFLYQAPLLRFLTTSATF
jgi:hypothetical protein